MIILSIILLCATAAASEEHYITRAGHFASVYEAALDKFRSYSAQGDLAACQRLIESKLVFLLRPDMRVYLLEVRWGKVKIRAQGQTHEVWTDSDAIVDINARQPADYKKRK